MVDLPKPPKPSINPPHIKAKVVTKVPMGPRAQTARVKAKVRMPHKKGDFYSDTPKASAKKIANQALMHGKALASEIPAIVPASPGKTTAFGGSARGTPHVPKAHGYGHSAIQRLGSIRLSGHGGAHRLGKR